MRLADWLIIALAVFGIATMACLIYFLYSNASQCVANPLQYFEKISNSTCWCWQQGTFDNPFGRHIST